MLNKSFNPMIIVKEDPTDPPIVVNSLVECHIVDPGVFITTCGCSSTE